VALSNPANHPAGENRPQSVPRDDLSIFLLINLITKRERKALRLFVALMRSLTRIRLPFYDDSQQAVIFLELLEPNDLVAHKLAGHGLRGTEYYEKSAAL
jgi:hypothetical protein